MLFPALVSAAAALLKYAYTLTVCRKQLQTVVAVIDGAAGIIVASGGQVEIHRVGGQGHGQGLGMGTYDSHHHHDDGQKHVDQLGPLHFLLGLLRLLRWETTHLPLQTIFSPNYGVACAWIFSVPV